MLRLRFLLALGLAGVLALAPAAHAASADMVISQVYAGGGNAGASYTNDFVELFNRGTTTVDLSGWSIQYATSSGTSWQVTALTGSVAPGRSYLVQFASTAAVGAPLPTPDAVGTSNLAASGGKVALVRGSGPLSCGSVAGSCSADTLVADLIGWGSATDFEGSSAAPALTSTTAATRAEGGCIDTDSNSADFSTSSPAPRNSATSATPCSAEPPRDAPTDSHQAAVDVDIEPVLSMTLERQSISFGPHAAGDTPNPVSERVVVASNHAAGYALTVHRSAFVPADLPLGLAAAAPTGGELGGQFAGGGLVAIPVAPSPDLLIGTTSGLSAPGGDVWPTNVGFVSPLPVVAPGRYTATVTFTAIGR